MKQKPIMSYQRLLLIGHKFANSIKWRNKANMFWYSAEKMRGGTGYRLDDVYQRVLAAQDLGYEVMIIADSSGMQLKYIEKIKIPMEFET